MNQHIRISLTRCLALVLLLAAFSVVSCNGCEEIPPDDDPPTNGGTMVNDPTGDPGNNTTQSEPAIVRSNAVIIVGYNDSSQLATTQSLTGYAFSTDGGATFIDAGTLAPVAGGRNIGDAAFAVDGSGTVYFATLASNAASQSFIGVARSTSLSPTVQFGTPVLIGGLSATAFQDKEFIAADATGGAHDGNVYVVWTEFPNGLTRILFSRSTDGGTTYSAAVQISTSGSGVSGAFPVVGPGGELYVAWQDRSNASSSRIVFRRSTDGGVTFDPEVTAATFTPTRDNAATTTCGRPALKGNIRVNEFPSMSVDAQNGNLYIAYPGDPDNLGTGDDSDIFVVRSTDGGQTWSASVNVTKGPAVTSNADATSNDNFFPFVGTNNQGEISVFFYDRRDDNANQRIALYRAVSTDNGVTWLNERIGNTSFDVPRLNPNFDPIITRCYMGDYNFLTLDQADLLVVWGDNSRVVVTVGFPTGRPDPDIRFRTVN